MSLESSNWFVFIEMAGYIDFIASFISWKGQYISSRNVFFKGSHSYFYLFIVNFKKDLMQEDINGIL